MKGGKWATDTDVQYKMLGKIYRGAKVGVTLHVGVHKKTLTPTYSLVGAASAAKKFWFNLRD